LQSEPSLGEIIDFFAQNGLITRFQ